MYADFHRPANDYKAKPLKLNDYVVDNNSITYFVNAAGDSMFGAGIFDGTMLVMDKSLEVIEGDIVVAFVNGECFVKRLRYENVIAYLSGKRRISCL